MLVIVLYDDAPSCPVPSHNYKLKCFGFQHYFNCHFALLIILTYCVVSIQYHPGMLQTVSFLIILSHTISYCNIVIHFFPTRSDQIHRLPSHSMKKPSYHNPFSSFPSQSNFSTSITFHNVFSHCDPIRSNTP